MRSFLKVVVTACLILFLTLVAFNTGVYSQTETLQTSCGPLILEGPANKAIHDSVKQMLDQSGLRGSPGLVVGVVSRNFNFTRGFGTTRIGARRFPNRNTLFAIGSVTKAFTGFCLSQLVVTGKINLSDKANRYLHNKLKLHPEVTVGQLITHYSGLPSFPGNMRAFRDFDGDGQNDWMPTQPTRNYSKKLLSEYLSTEGKNLIPGKAYSYSNLSIALAAITMQSRLKLNNYNSLIQRIIAKPLGLNNTGTNSPKNFKRNWALRASGHNLTNNQIKPVGFTDMGVLQGAGELITNANDMTKLLKALTGLQKTRLSNAFKEAIRPLGVIKGKRNIGYAIEMEPMENGRMMYYKYGETSGFSAMLCWQPDIQVGIVVLANRGNLGKALALRTRNLFKSLVNIFADQSQQLVVTVESEINHLQERIGRFGYPNNFVKNLKAGIMRQGSRLPPESPRFSQEFNRIGFKVLKDMKFLNNSQQQRVNKWFKQRRRKRSLALYLRLGNKIKNGNSGYAVNGGM